MAVRGLLVALALAVVASLVAHGAVLFALERGGLFGGPTGWPTSIPAPPP